MGETTGFEAKTIHRLLEYSVKQAGFQKNDHNPLSCDLLIVDEASMIDTILMHHLLKAVPMKATVIFVGDVNQLPSVGAGNVLKDMIDSGQIPVAILDRIFRQAQASRIIRAAHEINQGIIPYFSADDRESDCYFIQKEEPEEVLATIIELVTRRIPKRFGFDPVEAIQVLTPMHRGAVGAGNLNSALQNALNPNGLGFDRGNRTYRVNDKVMQIRNNYDKEVFNGDIGKIVKIDMDEQSVSVRFEERIVGYEFAELDELMLAYAISVHKSQGSEYPCVIIPLMTQHFILLQRNLIYTGITRGKGLAVLVGTRKALAIAVKNDKPEKRYTYLKHRLAASF
jgi:exodeoxyribonuclease V alpha subunit